MSRLRDGALQLSRKGGDLLLYGLKGKVKVRGRVDGQELGRCSARSYGGGDLGGGQGASRDLLM